MKKFFQKVVSFTAVLAFLLTCTILPSEVYAGTTAKALLDKAAKKIEAATSISARYEGHYNEYNGGNKDNIVARTRVGIFVADDKCSYGVYLDDSQSEDGWEEYEYQEKIYRKSYHASEWSSYTDGDYDSDSDAPTGDTFKTSLTYLVKNLKKPKIKTTTSKSYVISGTLPKGYSGYKSVSITIDRKTGAVTKVKYTLKKRTRTYLNSSNTYTITGGSLTYSNISYGNDKVVLPDELKGR